jgi:hypothetical protein
MPRLIEWVDAEVTQRWGKVRAARVLHIMQTGCDCAVEHPLDQAHADLSSALTLVTGNPTSTIDDLIGGRPGRDELEQLTDAQLLRRTARELAMAVVMVAHVVMRQAALVLTMPGEVGILFRSLAACAQADTTWFAQANNVQAASPEPAETQPSKIGTEHDPLADALRSRP